MLAYKLGEIYWMTGVIAVAVVYAIFAYTWAKDAPKGEDD